MLEGESFIRLRIEKYNNFVIIWNNYMSWRKGMFYIAICDDDKKSVSILKEKMSLVLKKNNIVADISLYTQSQILQYDIQEGEYFDLILSDIEMPHMDGMHLARYVKQYLSDVIIIFITSHTKYAIDAFELAIFRYVPKNSLNIKFEHAIQDAFKLIVGRSNRVYCIDMPSRIERILHQKILYIEREGKNSVLTLTDGSITKVRKSLSDVMKELASKDFMFIDRGTIVNIQYIVKIKDDCVELKDGVRLLASHTKIEYVKQAINSYWEARI